jgi:Lon protease-like protein
MDTEGERGLPEFRNVCRLFPLPRVVLFPHSVVPLHIFEPRYRQMTQDALASDKLVVMVQWRKPFPTDPSVEPQLEPVGCLGRIVQHEPLPDGRFNFLLLGCKRVRLGREIPAGKLYRVAEGKLLEDENTALPQERRIEDLRRLFRQVCEQQGALDPEVETLLESNLPLGPLTDRIAHSLELPPAIKQWLLAEARVDCRGDFLVQLLRKVDTIESSRVAGRGGFPPPFSAN